MRMKLCQTNCGGRIGGTICGDELDVRFVRMNLIWGMVNCRKNCKGRIVKDG